MSFGPTAVRDNAVSEPAQTAATFHWWLQLRKINKKNKAINKKK